MKSIIQRLQERFAIPDTVLQFFLFGFVGTTGALINTVILYMLTSYAGMHYLLAAGIATQIAIITNFIGNNVITFRGTHHTKSITQRFLTFQAVSMVGLVLTLITLWSLTSFFGKDLLLVWNLIAIFFTFTANFVLNKYFTWGTALHDRRAMPKTTPFRLRWPAVKWSVIVLSGIIFVLLLSMAAHADVVTASHMGYHPTSNKQAIVYTSATTGVLTLHNANTNAIVGTYTLAKPTDANGNPTTCQGNTPCLVADFSAVTTPGSYYVQSGTQKSQTFSISNTVYASNVPVFLEFFDAQLQQKSAYHADMHTGYTPALPTVADGSFIMEADQAALTLIRLGSAYKRNPSLFQTDKYNILASGKPDMQEHIKIYVDYLKGLQGVQVQERTDGVGFRLDRGVKINNAFVPGPTSLTSIDVYTPGTPPTKIQTVPVVSLCGNPESNTNFQACVTTAANYYKCQVDEPCLNITYVEKTGTATYAANNYAVSKGWGYEFGCYFDIPLTTGVFNDKANPCFVFQPQSNRQYTTQTLLGYAEAIPAVYAFSAADGQALLDRTIKTQQYIKATYPAFGNGDDDAGFYGAALFLLYDYTQEPAYLQDAYALRDKVSTTFVSDATHGNEFYWEEYIKHQVSLQNAGLTYAVGGKDPETFFYGKLIYDYKDAPQSIGKAGDRVFQFANSVQFQNSRYILTEGVLAAKTSQFYATPDSFIPLIADSQLSWITGANAVQNGITESSPLVSRSFIFGIGNHPEQFHSRYLVDTGYRSASGGTVEGARGTGYQFLSSNAGYVYFDGAFTFSGTTLGAFGNGYGGEPNVEPFHAGRSFANGKTYIPGWINGAYDTSADSDSVFNYRDNLNTYEYTETTNEMVATAVELFAYLDAQKNNKALPPLPIGKNPPPRVPIVTNNTNSTLNATLSITSTPVGASILIDGVAGGVTPKAFTLPPGMHSVTVYTLTSSNDSMINLSAGQVYVHNVVLGGNATPAQNGTLQITTTPQAYVFIDTVYVGTASNTGAFTTTLSIGEHAVKLTKTNYTDYSTDVTISPNQTTTLKATLTPLAGTLNIATQPTGATVYVNGRSVGAGPLSVALAPGSYLLQAAAGNQASTQQSVTITGAEQKTVTLTLTQNLTNATLTGQSSTVPKQGGNYTLPEGIDGDFTAILNGPGTVSWSVDGVAMGTTFGTQSTFRWTPGALYTDNSRVATITATAGNATLSWQVTVVNMVNPFFSGAGGTADVAGSTSTELHVYTKNPVVTFNSLSVTIENSKGRKTYALNPTPAQQPDETNWQYALTNLPAGTTYIREISGFDTKTGKTITFTLGTERGHQVGLGSTEQPKPRPKPETRRESRESFVPREPELVYVVFDKDVVAMGEKQTIKLDAKDDIGISRVQANLIGPNGEFQAVEMTLISGSKSYGTWSAEISTTTPGLFKLGSVTLLDDRKTPKEEIVEDRSFYVVSDTVGVSEELGLVYTLLDASKVKANSTVTFRLDARDRDGVTEVVARGENDRGHLFTIPMKLVEGSPQYGTWEGTFIAREPDSTYSITNVTMENSNATVVHPIKARSVYVEPVATMPLITGQAVTKSLLLSRYTLQQLLRKPLVPTLIGFTIMAIIITIIALDAGVRKRFKDYVQQ
jgi:putative flippase GtrA